MSSFKGERSESLVKLSSSSSASPTKSIKSDHSGELNASTMCMPSQTPNKIAHSPSSNHNSSINSSEFRSVAAWRALFSHVNLLTFKLHPISDDSFDNNATLTNRRDDQTPLNNNRKFKLDERVPPLPPKPTKIPMKPLFSRNEQEMSTTRTNPWNSNNNNTTTTKEKWYMNTKPTERHANNKIDGYFDSVTGSFV